jgi:hypothetical protein
MVLPARLSISISVLLTTHLAEGLNEIIAFGLGKTR